MDSWEHCKQQDDAANNYNVCYILCTVTEIGLDWILNKSLEEYKATRCAKSNIYASNHAGNFRDMFN